MVQQWPAMLQSPVLRQAPLLTCWHVLCATDVPVVQIAHNRWQHPKAANRILRRVLRMTICLLPLLHMDFSFPTYWYRKRCSEQSDINQSIRLFFIGWQKMKKYGKALQHCTDLGYFRYLGALRKRRIKKSRDKTTQKRLLGAIGVGLDSKPLATPLRGQR
jgi:hypothetical protein